MAAGLPSGFFITSINGKRCTAVPRAGSAGNGSSNASSAPVLISAQVTKSAAPIAAAFDPPPPGTTSITPNTTAAPIAAPPPAPSPESQFSSTPSNTASTTAASVSVITTPSPIASVAQVATSAELQTPAAVSATPPPALELTTNPSPSTAIASPDVVSIPSVIPQGGVTTGSPSADTSSPFGLPTISTLPPTASPTAQLIPAAESSSGGGTAVNPPRTAMVVGSTMGGLAFVAAIGFFWWWCARKRRARSSFITYLNRSDCRGQEKYYEFDNGSLGPTSRGTKIRTQATRLYQGFMAKAQSLSAAAKDGMGWRNSAPSVNMDRGNSQFLESIPQHSRSASAASAKTGEVTARDRLKDWWSRVTADANFNFALHRNPKDSFDHSAAAGTNSGQDSQVIGDTTLPNFRNFLEAKENELLQAADGRRRSQSMPDTGRGRPQSELGSLAIDFSKPFGDNYGSVEAAVPRLYSNGPTNPFRDPIAGPIASLRSSPPKPTATTDYAANVRHSRGLSISSAQRVSSRYPSTIRLSRDSNRDTVFSAFSNNVRKGKGRSDPFDLERPEFRVPPPLPIANQSQGSTAQVSWYLDGAANAPQRGRVAVDPVQNRPRVASESSAHLGASTRNSYTSQYSTDWGDPGPDLGVKKGKGKAGEISSKDNNNTRKNAEVGWAL